MRPDFFGSCNKFKGFFRKVFLDLTVCDEDRESEEREVSENEPLANGHENTPAPNNRMNRTAHNESFYNRQVSAITEKVG